ncbi:MAG: 3'(2'),5'-bisphosphate nucleotidase CysQ [Pseudomonadales bacterium]|nr:3'(2'),5'-bisphosphate nucleotidase CysQ [Pseudomonadales bacterium]
MSADKNALCDGVIEIAKEAGAAILQVYGREDFDIESKSDDSPLTAADLASHKIIIEGLTRLAPEIPIMSEESDGISFEERSQWDTYFLVDPLDGTKEFIKRNGEFTVNIALIENGVPTMGVVYVPVMDVMYSGIQGVGAFRESAGERKQIQARPLAARLARGETLVVVASRSHSSPEMEDCMKNLVRKFAKIDTRNMGSSLKLCLVAEGEADMYPRLAPTSEWDTAAAHAVVEAAGGLVVDDKLVPLRYNTKESVLNPHFYVLADPAFHWNEVLKG